MYEVGHRILTNGIDFLLLTRYLPWQIIEGTCSAPITHVFEVLYDRNINVERSRLVLNVVQDNEQGK